MSWYPPEDGLRFVAAVQKKDDKQTFVNFYESDKKSEAIKEAENLCKNDNITTLVYERGNWEICRFHPPEFEEKKNNKK